MSTSSSTTCPTGLTMVHDPLTQLDPNSKPTPEAIRILRKELYANARRNHTTIGGGHHGHLGLLMPNIEYIAISHEGEAYAIPDRPDIPDYAALDDAGRSAATIEYKTEMRTYNEATALADYLTTLIIQAVPPIYIGVLSDDTHGFGEVTPGQLLTHLMETYGKISKKAMAANLKSVSAPWDPDTPIEHVFTHGKSCRQFAAEGGDPITDAAYIRILAETFTKSGVLDKAVDDWEDLEEDDQTVAALMAHFTKADNNRRDKNSGLKGALSANSAITNGAIPKTWTYCWSHGLCTHTGVNCPTPATNHNKAATLDNLMGGCTYFQRPPDYKAIFKLEYTRSNTTRTGDRDRKKAAEDRKKAATKAAAANTAAIATAVAAAMAAQAATC